MNANKVISFVTGILVTFLAGAAFVLSYDALYRLALANGITPWLAWLWPLCLDAFMVSASLAVLRNSLVSERTWYQWILVGAFTILSVSFNAIHAPDTWLARAVFAIPPAVVFLAFELLVSQVKSAVKRRGVSQTLSVMESAVSRARAELADLEKKADAMTAVSVQMTPAGDTTEDDTEPQSVIPAKAERHALILGIIAGESGIKYQDLAARVGVSLPTVKRDMAELIDTGRIKRNGHGLEPVSIMVSEAA
jgi:hypothetical protein